MGGSVVLGRPDGFCDDGVGLPAYDPLREDSLRPSCHVAIVL
jgi:hypothetical protein